LIANAHKRIDYSPLLPRKKGQPSGAPATPSAGRVLPFRGAAKEAQSITAPEWLLSGPAETGKTFAGLYRLDTEARRWPDSQWVLARKMRTTMDSTVLDTWRDIIKIRGGVTVYGGEKPQWYDYSNGARVWVIGFDHPERILSGEFDGIYVNQAEELDIADWETATTRATGRGAKTDTPMTWGDCNPSAEDHWIKFREADKSILLLNSKHEDNPTLFTDAGEITSQGIRSLSALDKMTGARYWRLRMGLWVGAEGQHFEAWDEDRHVLKRESLPEITGDWIIWGSLDYGFGHPFASGVFGQAPDGTVHLMAEYVTRKTLIPDLVSGYITCVSSLGLTVDRVRFIAAGHDMWATRGGDDTESLADKWEKAARQAVGHTALRLERATVDRVNGAATIQEGLGNKDRQPTLFIWEGCAETRKTIPRMVTDPKNAEDVKKVNADANGRGGDDPYDMLRYGVMVARRVVSVSRPREKKANVWSQI
jgi:hypothetical protein